MYYGTVSSITSYRTVEHEFLRIHYTLADAVYVIMYSVARTRVLIDSFEAVDR